MPVCDVRVTDDPAGGCKIAMRALESTQTYGVCRLVFAQIRFGPEPFLASGPRAFQHPRIHRVFPGHMVAEILQAVERHATLIARGALRSTVFYLDMGSKAARMRILPFAVRALMRFCQCSSPLGLAPKPQKSPLRHGGSKRT